MKTKSPHFFRNAAAFFVLLFIFTASLFTQPQYYNFQNVGSSNNSFPFNVAAGKQVQWLIPANSLNQPSPVPPGNQITKLYFFTTNTSAPTYTTFMIRLGQSAITSLPTGAWYTGQLDTHYYRASISMSSTANGWMMITLDEPFVYDPTLSLIVEVGQCGTAGGGPTVRQNTIGTNTRSYSGTTGCPHTYSGQDGNIINFGVDVVPAVPPVLPDVLYYKFEQNPAPLLTPNCAIPPSGTNPAPVSLHTLGSGGQFDSCLVGIGTTNARIATGWNCNLANGSWTISFWVNNLVDMNPTYIFGDAGSTSFRCFYGGAAGANNLLLRGPMTDILIPCPAGPQVFHMVYDGTNVIIYRNGTLVSTNPRAINMPTGTGFFVGGYSSGFGLSGRMDEFRLVRRALSPAEVSAQWNSDLGGCGLVGVTQNNNQIPNLYSLSQNYPNPFNPVTNIKFALPNTGLVKLVVFDILGREVATLVNEVRTAGNYTVDFDASSLSSGVYFYRIDAGNFTQTKKMLLVK